LHDSRFVWSGKFLNRRDETGVGARFTNGIGLFVRGFVWYLGGSAFRALVDRSIQEVGRDGDDAAAKAGCRDHFFDAGEVDFAGWVGLVQELLAQSFEKIRRFVLQPGVFRELTIPGSVGGEAAFTRSGFGAVGVGSVGARGANCVD
jgi:hypothetical protein